MHTAVRPRFTSGIAVLGASAIIVTTASLAPHHEGVSALPAIPSVSTSVELSSLVNPLAAIGQIVQSTVSDVQGLVSGLLANPFPIAGVVVPDTIATIGQLLSIGQSAISGVVSGLQQYVPSSIQNFIQYAKAGNWETALGYIFTPLVGVGINLYTPMTNLFNILAGPLQTAANVVKAVPGLILQAAVGLAIAPLSQVVQSVGAGIDNIGAALKSGNLANLYNAVVNSAVNLTTTVIGQLVGPNGIVANLFNLRTVIAQALKPTSPSSTAATSPTPTAATLPTASTRSVTLSATVAAAAATSTKSTSTAAAADSKTTPGSATSEPATSTTKSTKGKKDTAASAAASGSPDVGSAAASTSSSSPDTSGPSTDGSTSNAKGGKGSHGNGGHKADTTKGGTDSSGGGNSRGGHGGKSGK